MVCRVPIAHKHCLPTTIHIMDHSSPCCSIGCHSQHTQEQNKVSFKLDFVLLSYFDGTSNAVDQPRNGNTSIAVSLFNLVD